MSCEHNSLIGCDECALRQLRKVHATTLENLTSTQARCTMLQEEKRALQRELEKMRELVCAYRANLALTTESRIVMEYRKGRDIL